MTAKTYTQQLPEEKIMDDLENKKEEVQQEEPQLDMNKLAMLKAKLKSQGQEEMPAKLVAKKQRSLKFGIVGSGQAGSNLSEAFYKLGYNAVAINTASQDLKHLEMPEENKVLLNHTIGGAAKERSIGRDAALSGKQEIFNLVKEKLSDTDINIFCTSLGGGSGSGSIEVIMDVLVETGKPLMVVAILPMVSEDVQTKSNSLNALAEVAKLTQSKKIANLVLVDNSKIEHIFSNVNQMEFFTVANQAIVEPLDMLNHLAAMPSKLKPLDPLEFTKILVDGEGLSTYGVMEVEQFEEETAIAEAVFSNLSGALLADLDIKQSKYVGYCVVAHPETWKKIPAGAINYANAIIQESAGLPQGVFKGVYSLDTVPQDVVKVYTIISGCGLPSNRITSLKTEIQELSKTVKAKEENRNLNLTLDTGANESVSAVQKVKDQIAKKNSAFGRFAGGVVDRRKG
jgi:cell division GTPase FtsZ